MEHIKFITTPKAKPNFRGENDAVIHDFVEQLNKERAEEKGYWKQTKNGKEWVELHPMINREVAILVNKKFHTQKERQEFYMTCMRAKGRAPWSFGRAFWGILKQK